MHPLNNSSQVTEAPAPKPRIGSPGYFSESNENGAPSYPGADWFNANIKEFMNALAAAGVEFDPDRFDHLSRAIGAGGKAAMLDVLTGFRFHESIHGFDRAQIALKGDGTEVLRADFPKLWAIAESTAVDQALIDANPTQYAANYGTGDGATTFTMPNYGLMPWEAAAGMYGTVGTTVEDAIRNFNGNVILGTETAPLGIVDGGSGVLYPEDPQENRTILNSATGPTSTTNRKYRLRIDASRQVPTADINRPKTNFSDVWIIHGEQAA